MSGVLILLLTVRSRKVCCSIGNSHPQSSIEGVSPEANFIWKEMETLIESYPLTMDTTAEQRDNQRMVLSKFHACLVKLANVSASHMAISNVFTNKVIMSVYKRRGSIIKTMLSSGHYLTIEQSGFVHLPGWNSTTELLEELLGFKGVMMMEHQGGVAYGEKGVTRNILSVHPLVLAMKLGMVDIAKLLVLAGVQDPHRWQSSVLCQAVINQNKEAVDYVLQVTRSEWDANKVLDQETLLCDVLTLREPSLGRSPMEIAHLQCSSGLSCDTLAHLLELTQTSCVSDYSLHTSPTPSHMTSLPGHVTSPPGHMAFQYGWLTCPAHQAASSLLPRTRWLGCVEGGRGCRFSQWSGQWRVYGDHKVGRADCDLLQIAASRTTPTEFERDFVNMR